MHRFWAASFPDDYPEMNYPAEWIRTYRAEIDWTMRVTDAMFKRLVKFADRHPEYQVWVTTSMGQAATAANPVETQLYLVDLSKFMSRLGFTPDQWSRRPAMLPQVNLFVVPGLDALLSQRLADVRIGLESVEFRRKDHGFFSIDMGQRNLDESTEVTFGQERGSLAEWGLQNTEIEDRSGTSAYHIPEGCLFIYDPKDRSVKPRRDSISTLEIAPALLRNFRSEIPSYMLAPSRLAPTG
jgi:hypothetical protein